MIQPATSTPIIPKLSQQSKMQVVRVRQPALLLMGRVGIGALILVEELVEADAEDGVVAQHGERRLPEVEADQAAAGVQDTLRQAAQRGQPQQPRPARHQRPGEPAARPARPPSRG